MTLTIPKTNPPAANSFVNLPVVTDWQDLQAEAVIFGVPHGKPYLADKFPNNQSTAPAALRAASPRILLDGRSLDADFHNFRYFLTLFSKFFASFPHGTCALSVSHRYLALDGIYHPI